MQFKIGSYHNYRTPGVIDTFTEQVLTETTFLSF